MKNIRVFVLYLLISVVLCAINIPSGLLAKMFIETKVISGLVDSISEENSVILDDGSVYLPAHGDVTLQIVPGQLITIKYYIADTDEKKYIEIAPGENSIKATALPEDTTLPKSKL